MSNHLGNVLAVVTDKKLPVEDNGMVSHYLPEIVSTSDYSPFGVELSCQTALDFDLIEEDVIYAHLQNTALDNNGNLESIGPSSPWGHYGARGQQVIMQGEYIEHEIGSEDPTYNHNIFVGLVYNFTDYLHTSLKYAWYFYQSGSTSMWKDGSNIGWVTWSHVAGDKFKIERKDGNINYYRNNVLTGTVIDEHPNLPMTIVTAPQKGHTKVYNLKVGKLHANNFCSKDSRYRYGFNGMEKDDEVKGSGNHIDFGARGYDPRKGRWLSVDPFFDKYPGITPFRFGLNNPITYLDPDGNTEFLTTIVHHQKTGKTIVKNTVVSNNVFTDGVIKATGGNGSYVNQRSWYDKHTTQVITIAEDGSRSIHKTERLLKNKERTTTSGPLKDSQSYAVFKVSWNDQTENNRETQEAINEEIRKEYGGSPIYVNEDPVGNSNDNAGLLMIRGALGDLFIGKGSESKEVDTDKIKENDTLIFPQTNNAGEKYTVLGTKEQGKIKTIKVPEGKTMDNYENAPTK